MNFEILTNIFFSEAIASHWRKGAETQTKVGPYTPVGASFLSHLGTSPLCTTTRQHSSSEHASPLWILHCLQF